MLILNLFLFQYLEYTMNAAQLMMTTVPRGIYSAGKWKTRLRNQPHERSWGHKMNLFIYKSYILHEPECLWMCAWVSGRICVPMNETVHQARDNGEVSDHELDLQSETERTLPYLGVLDVWTSICDVFYVWSCPWKWFTQIYNRWTDRNRIKAERRHSNPSRQVLNICFS